MKSLKQFVTEEYDDVDHQKEHDYHKGQYEYHTQSKGWNLEQNIFNRDWKKDAAHAKRKMKFHAGMLKKQK